MRDWLLDDGLRLVRAIQQDCRAFGYHVAMGGSVLNTGRSEKDVDLYFLPLENGKPREDGKLVDYLVQLWGGNFEQIGSEYGEGAGEEKQNAAEGPGNPEEPLFGAFVAPRRRAGGPRVGNPPVLGQRVLVEPPAPLNPFWNENAVFQMPPPQFVPGNWNGEEFQPRPAQGVAEPPPPGPSVYRWKLKFIRSGNDRIDCFII